MLHLDVILVIGPLCENPRPAITILQAVHTRSKPDTLLAANAGALVLPEEIYITVL